MSAPQIGLVFANKRCATCPLLWRRLVGGGGTAQVAGARMPGSPRCGPLPGGHPTRTPPSRSHSSPAPRSVFYKQRSNNFFPPASYVISFVLTQLPASTVECTLYSLLVYWIVGLFRSAGNFFCWCVPAGSGPCL